MSETLDAGIDFRIDSLGSWVRTIQLALEAAGVDSRDLLRRAGIAPAQLEDANARIPLSASRALWQAAVAATGDPAFGLRVARHVRQTTFHALGYSLVASSSLEEAFLRIARYFRVVTNAGAIGFEARGEDFVCTLSAVADGQPPPYEALDALSLVIVRLCRALAGRDFAPLEICLQRPLPADSEPYRAAFRCPLEFSAAVTALHLDGASLRRRLPTANAQLAQLHDQISARTLRELGEARLVGRVRAALVEKLPRGEPSQAEIARELHLSLRSLQRRLNAEGTHFKAVLNQARHDLALSYLADPAHSISDIAYLLGFADVSSFTRAFRRWTGEAPRARRQAGGRGNREQA